MCQLLYPYQTWRAQAGLLYSSTFLVEDDMGPTAIMADLQTLVGKPIKDICSLGYDDSSENHCAHFVSHALGIRCATLCGDMKFQTRHQGATIKVHELFNNLTQRGPWEARPKGGAQVLIFVTSAKNVRQNVMSNVPQKHVGIVYNNGVHNYSNTLHRVICDASVDIFHNKFEHSYHGGDISLFYGVPR